VLPEPRSSGNNIFSFLGMEFAKGRFLMLKPKIEEEAKGQQGTRTDIPQKSAKGFKPIDTRQESEGLKFVKAQKIPALFIGKIRRLLFRFFKIIGINFFNPMKYLFDTCRRVRLSALLC